MSLESRPANVERAGAITLRDLVRQALRMRPDRLVVGEVRGAEVVDMLAALNTGHEGGCATVHANSAADVPTRLEALGVAAGLTREAVHAQAAAALDAVIHMSRGRDGARRVAEIGVVERVPGGLRVVPIDDVGRRRASDDAQAMSVVAAVLAAAAVCAAGGMTPSPLPRIGGGRRRPDAGTRRLSRGSPWASRVS